MVYGHCTFPTDGGLWKVPVQWENGSVYELEYLGNSDCEPNAVNSKLQLVGMARWKYVPLKLRMYEWKQFIREKLGYPIIRTGGFPFALREKAVLWEEGEIYNLNDLILPEPSWILQSATDINDHGQIVGYGSHEGKTKAFLLTPIKKSGEGG
jgi:probable HAF family extracellular repeat protein